METRQTIKLSDIAVEVLVKYDGTPFYRADNFSNPLSDPEDEDLYYLCNERIKYIHIPTGVYSIRKDMLSALAVIAIKLEKYNKTTSRPTTRQIKV